MTSAPNAVGTPDVANSALAAVKLVRWIETFGRQLAARDPQTLGLNLLFSVLCLAAGWLIVFGLRRAIDTGLRRLAGQDGDRAPRVRRVAGLTWSLLRLAIYLAVALGVLSIWGLDPFALIGGRAAAALARAAGVVVFAVAAVEVTGFVTDRFVEGFARRSGDTRRAAQMRTLGPLITGFIRTVVIVISVLTFLSEIGVKVGPLLASAGVVGVAIGFGAQTLVKDFLTGVFLIAEDVVSVGDNVMIGESGGTVEAMTLRTIRLRDMNGTLHIFPYSEAQVIHNRTKTFSSYVFEVMVTYDTDVDRALQVMVELGEEMRAEPEFAKQIIRPFEALGVDRLDPLGVALKARVTTRPRDQWIVGREYNRRLKTAFEAAGVQLAYRPPGPPAPTIPTAVAPSGAAGELEPASRST
jgi:small conductance mechanosensitive channel